MYQAINFLTVKFYFQKMHILVMYATNATSLMLGKSLISSGHNLSLYCPREINLHQAQTIPSELKAAALGQGTTVDIRDSVDCFPDMDMVIFPLLDVLPHDERPSFGRMCSDLFRYMFSLNLKIIQH